jgi:hypothetical protein
MWAEKSRRRQPEAVFWPVAAIAAAVVLAVAPRAAQAEVVGESAGVAPGDPLLLYLRPAMTSQLRIGVAPFDEADDTPDMAALVGLLGTALAAIPGVVLDGRGSNPDRYVFLTLRKGVGWSAAASIADPADGRPSATVRVPLPISPERPARYRGR